MPDRLLYGGQQYDTEVEQYYLRTRYYNPVVGRFMQEDTYRGDGLNLYAYCANDPVMYYDPSGNGKVYRIIPIEGDWMKEMEFGIIEEWMYHEVYSDGYYFFDPMYSDTPILKSDYFKVLNGDLNDSGLRVIETVPYSER